MASEESLSSVDPSTTFVSVNSSDTNLYLRNNRNSDNNKETKKLNSTKKKKKKNRSCNNKKKSCSSSTQATAPPTTTPNKMKNRPTSSLNTAHKNNNWKQHVPVGTLDPISLESIRSLRYPPFVLKTVPPFDPLPLSHWWTGTGTVFTEGIPFPSSQQQQQQNGMTVKNTHDYHSQQDQQQQQQQQEDQQQQQELYHFFDGKVLAYYMVSQLQFMDPLNRRELSKHEIVALDTYMKKYKLYTVTFASVLEAYEAKRKDILVSQGTLTTVDAASSHSGTTTSAAVARNTPLANIHSNHNTASRAFLLQQEATSLLHALFVSPPSSMNNNNRENHRRSRVSATSNQSISAATITNTYTTSHDHHENDDSNPTSIVSSQRRQEYTRRRNAATSTTRYSSSSSGMDNTSTNQNNIHPQLPSYTHDSISNSFHGMDSYGMYGESENSGLLIIDDDLNPGLRGGPSRMIPQQQQQQQNTSIRHSIHGLQQQALHFPQLPSISNSNTLHNNSLSFLPRTNSSSLEDHLSESISSTNTHTHATTRMYTKRAESSPNLGRVGSSKTLQKISNLVAKSDPKEIEKQRKAREEWLHKTAMIQTAIFDPTMTVSNQGDNVNNVNDVSMMTLSINGYARNTNPSITTAPTHYNQSMIERNKVLADALGVVPSTVRNTSNINSGWTRPTSFLIERDEFGHELNIVQYPDSLIIQARERMTELIKLERKWMVFLQDDTAASVSLKPMDKPTRAFVHEYSDYWKLQTQSYDQPPNRYIHCVKMLDTAAPYPQLSAAAKKWRGAINKDTTTIMSLPHQQSTGQLTRSESYLEILHMDERPPLKLSKLGETRNNQNTQESMYVLGEDPTSISNRSGSIPSSSIEPAARFAPLFTERERPKLLLQPRSIKVQLDGALPVDNDNMVNNSVRTRPKQSKEEKKMKAKAKKESILAKAFASDESSDWDVGDALYSGDDDE